MFNNRIQKRYDLFGFLSRDLTYLIKGAWIRLSNLLSQRNNVYKYLWLWTELWSEFCKGAGDLS